MIINSQLGGKTPTGTKSITANGVYDVTDFASADVQVPTTAPAHYIEKAVDANGKLINSANIINLNGVTDVGDYVLYYAYGQNTSISGAVDMSDLTTLSGSNACYSMFYGCTGITSIDLSGLTTLSGTNACYYMFYGCTGLTSVDLSGLTTVNGSGACQRMFRNCTSLTTLSFPALTSNSFGSSYTNQFNNMLQGVTGCTVHFPSNLQSVIGSWADVTAGFGGTNTTVLYDLPATV